MKDFNQVHKLLLCHLEDLDKQLIEITTSEYPLIHSSSIPRQQKKITLPPLSIIESTSFNDLERIVHAIIQIDKE